RGHRTLAGLTCEDFAVRLHRGSGTVCVTSDGVILRAQGQDNDGHAGTLTALRVVHAPIDPKQFDVPPDYADIGAMLGRFAR
ncbi:hypothetical protein, partial [Enterococcus faecium]|uniref:hypothetical protein n=1 Tax=Enterococcus faecium TaxID=1352 RepID=UPI003F440C38